MLRQARAFFFLVLYWSFSLCFPKIVMALKALARDAVDNPHDDFRQTILQRKYSIHRYQMKHDDCVICRKPEKRCITLRAQVISLPNWQQEETSHWKIPRSRCTLPIMIQSLPWTMLWLFSRFNPTISLRSVSRWQSSEQKSFFFNKFCLQARCFFFLGQFERSLLVEVVDKSK